MASIGMANTVALLLGVFVACSIVKCLLILLANKQVGYTIAHISTDLRLKLLDALFTTRWEYFLRQPIGRLTNAVSSEANRAAQAFNFATKLASVVLESLIYVILAILVSWQATLMALVVGAFVIRVLRRLVRKTRRDGQRQTDLLQSLIARMTDCLRSIKPLKAMARETSMDSILKANTSKLNRVLRKQVLSVAALAAFQEPILIIFLAVTLYVTLVYLSMSLGTIMAMVYLIRRVLKNIQKAQREYQQVMRCESAYWSLKEKIQEAGEKQEPRLGDRPASLERTVRLDQVSFAYEKDLVLDNVSLILPAGLFVALLGPSGAGKTTVADLIIGLLRPQEGEVWIDQLPLAEIDIRSWRGMIGYVPQDTLLLHDSVYVNITLGGNGISEKDVEDALRAAGAWDFVSSLSKGVRTILGEHGSTISGGQRQRIAIARALVKHPRLLILDEATTALDPETEAAICRTLQELSGKVTILSISHQSAMLEASAVAYRLENGKVELIKGADLVGSIVEKLESTGGLQRRKWASTS
jgi:ATP-binding cassette subfamily C protein